MKILISLIILFNIAHGTDMPCPFNRILTPQSPPLSGDDVFILQNLLIRSKFVDPNLSITRKYDEDTVRAVTHFQSGNNLQPTGIFNENTAKLLLDLHIDDGYKDDGKILPGYKYKVHVPVYKNRSIEVMATLYDAKLNPLHTFKVRAHGQNNPKTGEALNQFCGSGSTPTGLIEFDLNSPEDEWSTYGPYPVNRAVTGIKGNAAIVISDIRDGILLHVTPDDYPSFYLNPDYDKPMIDSHGCLHAHPPDVERVWEILNDLGIEMRINTDGALPYPYKPQGILSIEQID